MEDAQRMSRTLAVGREGMELGGSRLGAESRRKELARRRGFGQDRMFGHRGI